PGDTIAYTATIKNELRDRYALGLFEVTAPPVIQAQALVPKPYRLAPNEQATISGNVAESALAQSQDISLTTTAGAIIANLRQVADGRQLWLSFNENPNATRFIDNSLLGNHATCLGSTCPVSGEAGYSGRGLRFDGVDDRLTAPVNVPEDSYTLSLWFKSTCSNCGLFSTVNTTTGAHDRDVYLKFGDVCALVNGNEICSPESIKYNDGNWHNVIHTFGGVQGNQQLFVDGVQRISSYASSTPFNQDNAVYIGYSAQVISPPNPWNGYLNGSIDEVEVYPRALSNPEIEARFKAPIFYAKFDESAGSLHFADASAFHHSMYCTAVLSRCPTAGQSGPQGKAVSFNHRQNLAVEENDGLNLNRGDGHFSLVAWISPAASDGGRQVIMGADAGPNDRQRYPTLYLQGNQLTLSFGDGNSICNAPSGSILAFGQWQHVAVTFDGTNVTFFVNKQAVASSAACAGKKPYPTKWFEIGRANDDATIFFMYVNIEDEGDGPGSAEYSLIFNRHEIWTQDKIWENTTRLINKEATIMGDGGNRFILCETDEDGHRDDCSGSNDINVDRTIYNTSIGDDSQSYNNDGRGTLYWRIWNEFYSGKLDELRIYDYALVQDEVTDLYDNTARGLEIRLDETPGADIFYDTSGNNLNGVCAGATCPVTGVAGRSNQAATFDGVNDYIDVPADIPETDYTLSLWFKTSCNNCGLVSADAGTLG
ncbi:MAG TPA: LamG domain-containing protein, partial [Anaerolineae bacterium]|nr:LamG domain-containing protein [Anaerolineae bacterium]